VNLWKKSQVDILRFISGPMIVPSTVTSETWLHDQIAQNFIPYKRPGFLNFVVKTLYH
jgi:hypothetical protein